MITGIPGGLGASPCRALLTRTSEQGIQIQPDLLLNANQSRLGLVIGLSADARYASRKRPAEVPHCISNKDLNTHKHIYSTSFSLGLTPLQAQGIFFAMAPASLSSSPSGTSLSSLMSGPDPSTPWTEVEAESFTASHHGPNGNDHAPPNRGNDAGTQQPIAIVGMSCRLPGNVSSPAEFWELCSRARSGFMTGVPKDRFNHDAFYHPNPGKTGTYHAAGGYFLEGDVATFDAPFFGLTEKEALAST